MVRELDFTCHVVRPNKQISTVPLPQTDSSVKSPCHPSELLISLSASSNLLSWPAKHCFLGCFSNYKIVTVENYSLLNIDSAGSGLKELTLGAALIDFQGSVPDIALCPATPLEFIIQVKS